MTYSNSGASSFTDSVDAIVFLGMFAVLLMLLFCYTYEYVRYKTVKNRTARRVNKVMFGWLALMGLYCALRISLFLATFIWVVALLGYLWDRYIVDRMP